MNSLYPLKFKSILLNKVWGGSYLKDHLGKQESDSPKIGESLEISSVDGYLSVVSNGFLKNNNIDELIEIYMGDLVGDAVYEKFGNKIPLLIKYIDANSDLSIQVHPDDVYAMEKHQSMGKNEMWYVLDAKPGAYIIPGFSKDVSREEVEQCIEMGNFDDILAKYPVKKGDAFMIPAGRVHALCSGVVVAEIQQTSDVTYRLFDYNRLDDNGKLRDLHVKDSLNVLSYKKPKSYAISYDSEYNKPCNLVQNSYFTVNYMHLTSVVKRDYYFLDSFVIVMCLEGNMTLNYNSDKSESITKGETILVPAELRVISFVPEGECAFLEVYYEGV